MNEEDDMRAEVSAEEPVAPESSSVTGAGHYFRNLALAAVAVVIVCGGIVAFSNRGSDDATSDDSSSYEDEAAVEATVALEPEELCIEELSEWLPWVTGMGSTLDAAAEWGMQAEEYKIVIAGWSEYQRQLYQVGVDKASGLAYSEIARGCRAMTYDYQPGHLPPG